MVTRPSLHSEDRQATDHLSQPQCFTQRIQTVEDTAEAINSGIFDWKTNQIIEQQQRDTEILIYSDKCHKEHNAAWEACLEYAKVVDANTTRRTNAQIATLERRVKTVQAAVEKRMRALQQEIFEKYKNNSNFFFDNSHSYMDSYSKAKMLITDFSGTAYTFAYSTLRPVIFFSKNENKFFETKIADLFFYQDRLSVGLICQNIKQLLKSIAKINKKKDYNKNKIFNLRKKRIKYVNKSLDQTIMQILKICKKI